MIRQKNTGRMLRRGITVVVKLLKLLRKHKIEGPFIPIENIIQKGKIEVTCIPNETIEGPTMTLSQHSDNYDKSVAIAMKRLDDGVMCCSS